MTEPSILADAERLIEERRPSLVAWGAQTQPVAVRAWLSADR
jgi:hypothetical protein